MCLIINQGKHKKNAVGKCLPQVLAEDMVAFKRIYNSGKSQYQDFWYEPKTLYKKRKLRPTKEAVYGAGFHAYLLPPQSMYANSKTKKIIAVTIPKGATVFFGGYGDVVTNMLITPNFKVNSKHD